MEAIFEGEMSVSVRCGGRGSEMVGQFVRAKTKGGVWKTVCLTKLIEDYGAGDVCTFTFSWK